MTNFSGALYKNNSQTHMYTTKVEKTAHSSGVKLVTVNTSLMETVDNLEKYNRVKCK